MKEFIYDNTFEGLLTTIFYAYSCREDFIITKDKYYTPSLLNEVIEVSTEYDKYNRVYKSIEEKLNNEVLQNIYLLYLSDILDSDTIALKYLKLCYRYGVNINLAKNNDIIILVDKYCKKVTQEAHLLKGFVRFKEVSPMIFYSSIEPVHNILPLIADHFSKRFSDEHFIIHDIKREIAITYNKEQTSIIDLSKNYYNLFNSLKDDCEFENLWKTFYSAINIKERENPKLRRRLMPKIYWNHLTELK